MDLPIELVYVIVDRIEDNDTLKACALVCWRLRQPAQGALFKSFTARNGEIAKADDFLAQSPHIAAYIASMTIELSNSGLDKSPELYPRLLSRLGGLRRCALVGDDRLLPGSSAILSQLERLKLYELRLEKLALDLPGLRRVIALAPSLSFVEVSVPSRGIEISDLNEDALVGIERLGVYESPCVCGVLARLTSTGFHSLEHFMFSVTSDAEPAFAILAKSAERLRSLALAYKQGKANNSTPAILYLPALKRVTFTVPLHSRSSSWLSSMYSTLLSHTTAPSLTSVRITYIPQYTPFCCPAYLHWDYFLPILDGTLSSHPARPHLCWALDLADKNRAPIQRWRPDAETTTFDSPHAAFFVPANEERSFAAFVNGVKSGMPAMATHGRLDFEKILTKQYW
uniref:F-box domain-containing protein n=1 Tax=Mycena chlorophos TaxID=658473 RepID=A0ABQ0MAQ8_MYCCL|nr:predicted protein [Mycena chlorophos]